MSLKNALMGYKKQLEDKSITEKIEKMLSEQNEILCRNKEKFVVKKPKNCYDPNVLIVGGNTKYQLNGKWWSISVHTGDESDCKVYKFHVKTAMGYRMFISAKTYNEAQLVVNEVLGNNYKVSGSKAY